jgi:hypothetical protein
VFLSIGLWLVVSLHTSVFSTNLTENSIGLLIAVSVLAHLAIGHVSFCHG